MQEVNSLENSQRNLRLSCGSRCPPILVVDDDPFNLYSLQDIFEEFFQLNCVFAHNGQDAVDKVRARTCCNFKMILMDNMMPIMDGVEATRIIKGEGGEKNKVVGFSAHLSDKEVSRWEETGVDFFCKLVG